MKLTLIGAMLALAIAAPASARCYGYGCNDGFTTMDLGGGMVRVTPHEPSPYNSGGTFMDLSPGGTSRTGGMSTFMRDGGGSLTCMNLGGGMVSCQ